MKRKRIISIISTAVLVIIIIAIIFSSGSKPSETIMVEVKQGEFRINVTTTGELEAKNSEKIIGPSNLREFRIWELKIEDIIPDGTVVDSGQYVARLDKTEFANKLKDKEIELEQALTQFTKTQLDTTLELRETRDELINLKYNLEERQIAVDQSIYEPPATQRQVQIDLDKAQRAYEQATSNYKVKRDKAIANMSEIAAELRKNQQEYDQMKALEEEFTIVAPQSGMVIYRRRWDGQKQGIGSTINMWDPVVAELPDLTRMISKTYVNEIDISKVKSGQNVEVGVDAFPDKRYSGVVSEVANIGEQLRNSNAKVFEVIIEINEFDSILRPAMTTKNIIITDIVDSVFYLPIECIHGNDSITYVYKPGVKQQVITGKSNENEIIIRDGLKAGDEVYLLAPEGAEDYRLKFLDEDILKKYEEEKQKEKERLEAEQLKNEEKAREKENRKFDPAAMEKMRQGKKRQGN
ncbi:MAG: efflux RND transporter periplasmic adaptor subunit [Bacteroidetes bacterium]|nr:efflux RND transporter periplasmic adaptor subunit [Bacteroidota bacterium]